MGEDNIKMAWNKINELCGPDYYGRDAAIKEAAKEYSNLVLDSSDEERIKKLGKKHLKLVANGLLDGEQFSLFLRHVISYER